MKKSAIKWLVILGVILLFIGIVATPDSETATDDSVDTGITETVSNKESDKETNETSSKDNSEDSASKPKETSSTSSTSAKPQYSSSNPSTSAATETISSQPTASTVPETPVQTPPQDNSYKTVYVTETGKRYHSTDNCRYLGQANAIFEATLSDAQGRGLTECKGCY